MFNWKHLSVREGTKNIPSFSVYANNNTHLSPSDHSTNYQHVCSSVNIQHILAPPPLTDKCFQLTTKEVLMAHEEGSLTEWSMITGEE